MKATTYKTPQQKPVARSPGGPQTKKGAGRKAEHGKANYQNNSLEEIIDRTIHKAKGHIFFYIIRIHMNNDREAKMAFA
jgi:hypothetical protein